MIIMLHWLRLYTLGSRGSRELKSFLETRLISSRVDQKLKNKEELHRFFKEEIRLENVGNGAGREGGFQASWKRFPLHGFVASNPRGRSLNFASKRPRISARSGHDRAAIGPRSRRDRATIVVLVARRSASDRLEAIPSLKLPDRGSIAPQSRFDRTAIVEFFY